MPVPRLPPSPPRPRAARRRPPAPPPDNGRRMVVAVVASAVLLVGAVAAIWLMPTAARADAPSPAAAVEPREPWVWPVAPPVMVVAPFRAPATRYAAGHRGIDIAAAPGDDVVAPAAGIVRFSGPVAGRGVVSIDHGAGVVSAIEPVEGVVAAGEAVAPGEVIGAVSSGGHCEAVCVHFGVRVDGEYVSPFLFLGGLPRAVLLPMR